MTIADGTRGGVTSAEHAEIKTLEAEKLAPLRTLQSFGRRRQTSFFEGELDPCKPMMMNFIDMTIHEGLAVGSICRVLRGKCAKITVPIYRAWRSRLVAARTVTDAQVFDSARDTA